MTDYVLVNSVSIEISGDSFQCEMGGAKVMAERRTGIDWSFFPVRDAAETASVGPILSPSDYCKLLYISLLSIYENNDCVYSMLCRLCAIKKLLQGNKFVSVLILSTSDYDPAVDDAFNIQVGVGLSYSKNAEDYTTADRNTALDGHVFLLKWFEQYPEFLSNPFYISGKLYAGIYVPNLASELMKGIYCWKWSH